jgi:hypothetical protein
MDHDGHAKKGVSSGEVVRLLFVVLACFALGSCSGDEAESTQPQGGMRDASRGSDATSDRFDASSMADVSNDGGNASMVFDGSTGAPTFDPCAPEPKPGYDPASRDLASCCDKGPAHCVPSSDVAPAVAAQLNACGDAATLCMPDPIIRAGGQYVPAPCRSAILNAPGACLSRCLPLVAGNPSASLLGQDDCGVGDVCVPCKSPFDGTSTGACELNHLFCGGDGGDAGDGGSRDGAPVEIKCPYDGPPLVDPARFAPCSPVCDGAHCIPADLVPSGQRALLSACSAGDGAPGLCLPDTIIASNNHFVPPTCTSLAGAEGRCVSTCLPDIAAKAKLLPQSTCTSGTICAPCFDPTSASPTEPTGACSLGCDAPTDPPLVLTCPWDGPAVLEPSTLTSCSPACEGSHCLPTDLVPASQRALLAPCPGGYCAPDPIIFTGNHTKPPTCTSIAGAEGRCLSNCLPSVSAQALLPQATCAAGQKCVPCYDPTSSSPTTPTGACSLGCDAPTKPPLTLTCPWTGPKVIDAAGLPGCGPTCAGAHCLPNAYVPSAQAAQLATCGSGATAGRCAPDDLIAAGGKIDPTNCVAFEGTLAPGRCLSVCLPAVASQPTLESSTCAAGQRCTPCNDPLSGADTGACGTLGCDEPRPATPFKFPLCCGGTSTCVPRSQIPDAQEPSLNRRDCPQLTPDVYLCAPTDQLPGHSPQPCSVSFSVIPPFSWDGVCVPDCIIGSNATIIPRDGCPVDWSCPPP